MSALTKRLAEAATLVYRDPQFAGEWIIAEASRGESHDKLRSVVLERPEMFGPLKGEARNWHGSVSKERRESMAALPRLADAAALLTLTSQAVERDLKREFEDAQRRARIGVPTPTEELRTALAQGEQAAPAVSAQAGLREEMNRLGLKLSERLVGQDWSTLHQGDATAIAKQLKIEEERATTLRDVARNLSKLQSSVHEHEQKLAAKQGLTFGM